MNQSYFGCGEFEFIQSKGDRALYKNMHNAITSTESWNWMRNYEPDPQNGFMWSNEGVICKINNKMYEDPVSGQHSGCSYGCMMRDMQFIAKNGYEAFKAIKLAYYKTQNQQRGQMQEHRIEILYPPEPPTL